MHADMGLNSRFHELHGFHELCELHEPHELRELCELHELQDHVQAGSPSTKSSFQAKEYLVPLGPKGASRRGCPVSEYHPASGSETSACGSPHG